MSSYTDFLHALFLIGAHLETVESELSLVLSKYFEYITWDKSALGLFYQMVCMFNRSFGLYLEKRGGRS